MGVIAVCTNLRHSQFSTATHQSHSSQHRDAVDALDGEVDEAGEDDEQVEDVPAATEVLLAERRELEDGLEREEGREDLVSDVEDVLEVLAHAVMLRGQEGGVEDDAERDGGLEDGVVHDDVERVLEAQPEAVAGAAPVAARAVPIRVQPVRAPALYRQHCNEALKE